MVRSSLGGNGVCSYVGGGGENRRSNVVKAKTMRGHGDSRPPADKDLPTSRANRLFLPLVARLGASEAIDSHI
jgi:hypothetical protein